MLQRILPQLRTLLTSKIRGSTQHLWCKNKGKWLSSCLLKSIPSHPKKHTPYLCRQLQLQQKLGDEHYRVTKQAGLIPAELQECSEPSSRWATKLIRNIALCPYTTGEEPPATSALHRCSGHIQFGKEGGLKLPKTPKVPQEVIRAAWSLFLTPYDRQIAWKDKSQPQHSCRGMFLFGRERRVSGCHVFPLNFCLSPQQSQITYRRLKAS